MQYSPLRPSQRTHLRRSEVARFSLNMVHADSDLVGLGVSLVASLAFAQKANTLTPKGSAAGWRLLFDRKTAAGWTSARGGGFLTTGWVVKNGTITVTEMGGEESRCGGDIVTTRVYSDFELSVDFKTSPGANSGIMYFVDLDLMP